MIAVYNLIPAMIHAISTKGCMIEYFYKFLDESTNFFTEKY